MKHFVKILFLMIISFGAVFDAPFAVASSAKAPTNAEPKDKLLIIEIRGIVAPIAEGKRLVNYAFMGLEISVADERSANILRPAEYRVKNLILIYTSKKPIRIGSKRKFDSVAFGAEIRPVIQAYFPNVKIIGLKVVDPEFFKPL